MLRLEIRYGMSTICFDVFNEFFGEVSERIVIFIEFVFSDRYVILWRLLLLIDEMNLIYRNNLQTIMLGSNPSSKLISVSVKGKVLSSDLYTMSRSSYSKQLGAIWRHVCHSDVWTEINWFVIFCKHMKKTSIQLL